MILYNKVAMHLGIKSTAPWPLIKMYGKDQVNPNEHSWEAFIHCLGLTWKVVISRAYYWINIKKSINHPCNVRWNTDNLTRWSVQLCARDAHYWKKWNLLSPFFRITVANSSILLEGAVEAKITTKCLDSPKPAVEGSTKVPTAAVTTKIPSQPQKQRSGSRRGGRAPPVACPRQPSILGFFQAKWPDWRVTQGHSVFSNGINALMCVSCFQWWRFYLLLYAK